MVVKNIEQENKVLYDIKDSVKDWQNEASDSDAFEGVGKEKIESLKETIKEIEEMVDDREKLSDKIFKECEKMKMDINNFLLAANVDKENEEATKEEIMLKQKQIGLSELQLNEKVACWKDIALLKKEKREMAKELSEREDRAVMFDNLLDDEESVKGGFE